MKAKKTREYVKAMKREYKANNSMINSTVATLAVEMAESELRMKAVESACYACISSGSGCGHIDRDETYCFTCDNLKYFREHLDKDA